MYIQNALINKNSRNLCSSGKNKGPYIIDARQSALVQKKQIQCIQKKKVEGEVMLAELQHKLFNRFDKYEDIQDWNGISSKELEAKREAGKISYKYRNDGIVPFNLASVNQQSEENIFVLKGGNFVFGHTPKEEINKVVHPGLLGGDPDVDAAGTIDYEYKEGFTPDKDIRKIIISNDSGHFRVPYRGPLMQVFQLLEKQIHEEYNQAELRVRGSGPELIWYNIDRPLTPRKEDKTPPLFANIPDLAAIPKIDEEDNALPAHNENIVNLPPVKGQRKLPVARPFPCRKTVIRRGNIPPIFVPKSNGHIPTFNIGGRSQYSCVKGKTI